MPRLPLATVRTQLRPFSPAAGRTLLGLAALTVVAGLMEALSLIVLGRAALAATSGITVVQVPGGLMLDTSLALLLCMVALLFKLGFSTAAARVGAKLSASVVRNGRLILTRRFLESDWAFQAQERTGDLQDYLTTSVARLNTINQAFVVAINASVNLGIIGCAALIISPVASVGALGAGAMLLLALRPFTTMTRRYSAAMSEATRDVASEITETVRLAQDIRVFGVREEVLSRLGDRERLASEPLRLANFASILGPSTYQTIALLFVVVAVLVVTQLEPSQSAALSVVVLLLLRGLTYGQSLQVASQNLAGSLPFLEAVHRRREGYTRHAALPGFVSAPDTVDAIRLEAVSYRYDSSGYALKDVSVAVPGRQLVGVIGPSGGGKTSLMQLLLRLRMPSEGQIMVNGVDLRDIEESSWAKVVAHVPQEPTLIRGSVADNIRFFRSLDGRAIEAAARSAHLHDDILRLPDGYDTVIGESGLGLSGGQRQRIALARALAGRPAVLVLDEPTSALDAPSEARIQATLEALRGVTTVFLVAHRMKTTEACDLMLVLDDGRVEAFGTRTEVAQASKFYAAAMASSRSAPAATDLGH